MSRSVTDSLLERSFLLCQDFLKELLGGTHLHWKLRVATIPFPNTKEYSVSPLGISIVTHRIHQYVCLVRLTILLQPCQTARHHLLEVLERGSTAQLPSISFHIRVIAEPGENTTPIGTYPIERGVLNAQVIAPTDEQIQTSDQELHATGCQHTWIGPGGPRDIILKSDFALDSKTLSKRFSEIDKTVHFLCVHQPAVHVAESSA